MEAQGLLVPLCVKPNLINPERKWEKEERKKGVSEGWDGLLRLGSFKHTHTYTRIHTQSVCHGLMLVDLWIW